MTLAALFICFAELYMVGKIIRPYGEPENFLFNAPLDEILIVQFKVQTVFIMFQLATIFSVMK